MVALFSTFTPSPTDLGVKYQPQGWNRLITASLFDITQYNSLAQDPNDIAFQNQRGQIRSRGFKLEGVVNPAPGLNMILAYTLLQRRVLDGDADTIGKAPSGIPAQPFSLWTDYTPPPFSPLPGFGAGAGIRYIGKCYGNDQNTFMNPSVVLYDAALHYDFGALDQRRIMASIRNEGLTQTARRHQRVAGDPARVVGGEKHRAAPKRSTTHSTSLRSR